MLKQRHPMIWAVQGITVRGDKREVQVEAMRGRVELRASERGHVLLSTDAANQLGLDLIDAARSASRLARSTP